MPSFVEIGPPVPEKILEDSATRLYDLRIATRPQSQTLMQSMNAVHNTIHVSYKQVYGFNRRQLAIKTPFLNSFRSVFVDYAYCISSMISFNTNYHLKIS